MMTTFTVETLTLVIVEPTATSASLKWKYNMEKLVLK